MDSGEALDDDGSPSEVPGLQSCVLSAGALAVVVISNDDPGHTVGLNSIKDIKQWWIFNSVGWGPAVTTGER